MTAKRFTTNGYKIYDTFHDGMHWLVNEVEAEEIVEIMNNLDTKARERSKALSKLQKENEQLKAQLLYDGDGVCNICKHQYLVETGKYYVAKCEKEHEECSKVDLQYCEDFELVRDYE